MNTLLLMININLFIFIFYFINLLGIPIICVRDNLG